MTPISRTFGPIHFEDLDPHRFEDLLRELIYDFRDWQSIEATGKSGSDEGFDIRAYEKVETAPPTIDDEEQIEPSHPMEGNLWMIQAKREKEIGPKRLEKILDDIDSNSPPYGYILAAPANFSKDSYDVFRNKLREKGVMEFYLWGRSELEDMLHLPKNDRILFTFFGVSLVTRRKSRATELRFCVVNKNKLYRILGERLSGYQSVLLRDSKDDKYPYKDAYPDFKERPRWREYHAQEFHPLGLAFELHRYFAYIDRSKKTFDFSDTVSLINRNSDSEEERRTQFSAGKKVEDFWEHLPVRNRGTFCVNGLVPYDAMLVIDEKGDELHKYPHIFIDFKAQSPFSAFRKYVEVRNGDYSTDGSYDLSGYTRVDIFPSIFPEPKLGTMHKDRSVELDRQTLGGVMADRGRSHVFYDVDGKYEFLEQRDVIAVANSGADDNSKYFMQITYKRCVKLEDFLRDSGDHAEYFKREVQRQVGREVSPDELVTIFEFKESYDWKRRQ